LLCPKNPEGFSGRTSPEVTSSFFAEFLEPLSLARLSALTPTHLCRFAVRLILNLAASLFSQTEWFGIALVQWTKTLHYCLINRFSGFSSCYYLTTYTRLQKLAPIILSCQPPASMHSMQNKGFFPMHFVVCSMYGVLCTLWRFKINTGILTCHPSTTPLWPRLRYRLTRRGRTFRRNPWVFGVADSHGNSTLLIPAFSLLATPPNLTVEFHCNKNAPLPHFAKGFAWQATHLLKKI